VIKTLGERVEREHSQYLRDSQRIEDRSGGFDGNAASNGVPKLGGTVDFQTLVTGSATAALSGSLETSKTTGVNGIAKATSWEDDVWGSILDGSDVSTSCMQEAITHTPNVQLQTPSPLPGSVRSSLSFPVTTTQSLPSTPKSQPAPLRPVGSALPNTPAIAPPPRQAAPISPPIQPLSHSSLAKRATSPPLASTLSPALGLSPIPTHMRLGTTPTIQSPPISTNVAPITPYQPPQISKPNYHVVIPSSSAPMTPSIPAIPTQPLQTVGQSLSPSVLRPASQPVQPLVAQMNGNIMAPSALAPLAWNPNPLAPKKITKNDWGDFDPLK
jgi:SCY1-like protein 2